MIVGTVLFSLSLLGAVAPSNNVPGVVGGANMTIELKSGGSLPGNGYFQPLNKGDIVRLSSGPSAKLYSEAFDATKGSIFDFYGVISPNTNLVYMGLQAFSAEEMGYEDSDPPKMYEQEVFEFLGNGGKVSITEPYTYTPPSTVFSSVAPPVGRKFRIVRNHGYAVGRSTKYIAESISESGALGLKITCQDGEVIADTTDGTMIREIVRKNQTKTIPTPKVVGAQTGFLNPKNR